LTRARFSRARLACARYESSSDECLDNGDQGVLEAVDHVRALAGRFNVRELVYDPWRFGQAAQELEREGLLVVAFPQHDARMIPASARLHAAVVEQRLTLPDDPELARHASDAIARHARRGWRIDKPNPRANIDAVIALAMAVERAEHKPEPVELLGWLQSPAWTVAESRPARAARRAGARALIGSQLSDFVVARDGACRECGSTRYLAAHHVIPRHEGGADHPANLIALCASRHARLEAVTRA
jgi:hypothetical protein